MVPQRKKLNLQISSNKSEGIQSINPATKQREFGIPWRDVEHVLCLPVPEKAQAARNFCVFPVNGDGVSNQVEKASTYEPMVWAVPEVKAKGQAEHTPAPPTQMIEALEAAKLVKVVQPNEKEFISQVTQGIRKGEKAYHVKAFRGSKDGTRNIYIWMVV